MDCSLNAQVYELLSTVLLPEFIPVISGGGAIPSALKLTIPPLTTAKLCALNLFFGRDNELRINQWKLYFRGQ